MIHDAAVAPGHDGQAVLVVRVRHGNGAMDTVTLDADKARRLLESCAAESLEGLHGQPWQRLLYVLEDRVPLSLSARVGTEILSGRRE